jgi:hypothetical protein
MRRRFPAIYWQRFVKDRFTARDQNGAKRNPSLDQIVAEARGHKMLFDDIVFISIELGQFREHREMVAFPRVNIASV